MTIRAMLSWASASLLVAVGPSCGHEHGDGDEHGHEHGDDQGHDEGHDHGGGEEEEEGHGHGHGDGVAIGITKWTDRLELFAEHPPAVAGEEVPFLAHLTVLDGFTALTEARVTLELTGPARVSAAVDGPLRPGIFQPVVTPAAAGTYQGRLLVTGAVEDVIEGFTIEVYPDAAAAARAHPPEEDEGSAISFLKEQQWQVPFDTTFAAEGSLVPSIEVSGQVETPPGGQAEIGAAVAGRIVAPAEGLPRPGQTVQTGDVLATIAPAPSSPEESGRASLAVAEAQARLQAAQAELARAERLLADRAIPEREVEDARREVGVAEEALRSARRAQAMFSGAASGRGAGSWRLTSPIDGLLAEVHATPGAQVTPGDLLFRVINTSELWIRARVPEQEASRIRADQDAAYRVAGLDDWLPIAVSGDAAGSMVTVGRIVDATSRTVDVIYALRDPDPRLRVGGLVRVSVPSGEPFRGVVIPEAALVAGEGRDVVYVQAEGEAFEERTVRIAARAGGRAGISAGVAAGERVVTEGATLIRLASRAGGAPAHGHVH